MRRHNERGVVSIFVVIFTSLLVTIVTVSFITIMLRNQQQASVADISQSAYDSALAGVEDAKRALASNAALSSEDCNTVKRALTGDTSDSEAMIQQDITNGFEQAYTCVKVDTEPTELLADLRHQSSENSSVMFPLTTVNNERFSTIEISWTLPADRANEEIQGKLGSPLVRGSNEWGETTPAMIRAQLIQYDNGDELTAFDSTDDGAAENTRTKFVYPADVSGAAIDTTPQIFQNISPDGITCSSATSLCSIRLQLNSDGDNYKERAFLRLTSLYNDARITVRVFADGPQPLAFEGVQAAVDSTGRAGDAFRRVNARVNLSTTRSPLLPEAALELEGNLCKTFSVTGIAGEYRDGGCQPARDPESED